MGHKILSWLPRRCIGIVSVSIFSACASPDTATAPITDPTTYFAELKVRERAITLALVPNRDTAQLHVSATLGNGSVISERIIFSAADSTISVDSTGLVTAKFPTTNLSVIRISSTYNGLTRRDSVQLRVLSEPPTVDMNSISVSAPAGSISIIPLLTEPSATDPFPQLGRLQLEVVATNGQNVAVPNYEIVFSIRSSDPAVAEVDANGVVTAKRIGRTFISVVAVANGVYAEDSIAITVGQSQYAIFQREVVSGSSWGFGGDIARIAAGGVVHWQNTYAQKIDILWDDTTNIEPVEANPGSGFGDSGRGNISGIGVLNADLFHSTPEEFLDYLKNNRKARRFPVEGIYRFRGVLQDSTLSSGVKGVVIVCSPGAIQCEQ